MTQTETLAATLPRDAKFHVGRYDRLVVAGSLITVEQDDIESGRKVVLARLVSNPRISGYVYVAALIPA